MVIDESVLLRRTSKLWVNYFEVGLGILCFESVPSGVNPGSADRRDKTGSASIGFFPSPNFPGISFSRFPPDVDWRVYVAGGDANSSHRAKLDGAPAFS